MSVKKPTRGLKYLEVIMRDVLDGLDDAASYMNFHSVPETVEILFIEAPARILPSAQEVIAIKQINSVRSQPCLNIVDYSPRRELKISA